MGSKASQTLHVEYYGYGERTNVFIPGLGEPTRNWSHSIGLLPEDYLVVLVDLLGFGGSPKPWTRYSVERHAPLDSVGAITLVGHSLSASRVVAYAACHRDQVENLVLIGILYSGSEEMAHSYLCSDKVKWGILYTNVQLVTIACILMRRVLGWILPYIRRDIPREVAEDLVTHTWRSSTSSLREVAYRYDAADELCQLSGQTRVLMIHERDDDIAPYCAIK